VGHDDRIDRLRWSPAGLTSAESLGLTIEHESFTRQRQTFGRQPDSVILHPLGVVAPFQPHNNVGGSVCRSRELEK
jgi:hypothetical protein